MKIITRYIFREIFHYFFLFLLFVIVFMLAYKSYDMREDFMEQSPSLLDIALFLIYSIPIQLALAMPIIGLMSTIFAYGLLAKNREVLALVAAGVSFARLGLPALVFGIGLMGFMFGFNEYIAPEAQRRAARMESVEIKGKDESKLARRQDVHARGADNTVYYVQDYLANHHVMVFPSVQELSDDGASIVSRLDADWARMLDTGDMLHWEFINAEQWTFNPDGSLRGYEHYAAPLQVELEPDLDQLLGKSKEAEEMNFGELKEYRNLLAAKGGEEVESYSISLHQKLAIPFAVMLMVMLGFAVVVDVHARHFTAGVAIGLLVAVLYYVLNAAFLVLGERDLVAPLVAGWSSVVLFGAMVYLLFLRLHTIRH